MIGLPTDDSPSSQRKRQLTYIGAGVLALLILFFVSPLFEWFKIWSTSLDQKHRCELLDKVVPASFEKNKDIVLGIVHDKSFRKQAVRKLSGAVQIDTQIVDNQPPPDENPEVWVKFKKFHSYLEKTFPQVYDKLEVETVNTYGLVFTWKGKNKKLKPLLLMAHQDTVPIQKDTLDKWTHPPLSGYYDGEWVYGRGSFDCKCTLIAILQSIYVLIEQGWKPERTIVLSFGFDEEAQGIQGAGHLGPFLKKRYGKNGVYAIVDEGSSLYMDPSIGKVVAAPATSEKGYMDLHVDLITGGGHSSAPPPHTGIGIMADLETRIENDPYESALTERNPFMQHLECAAVYSTTLPKSTRKAILRSSFDKKAMSKVISAFEKSSAANLLKTTQAMDIIVGGEKANSLPEHVKLVVNHRVGIDDSLKAVRHRFVGRVMDVAEAHNCSVEAFGKILRHGDKGYFNVTSPLDLDVAPKSPTDNESWRLLAGINRHVYEDLGIYTDIDYPILTVPSIMTGNTDTRYYWGITENIYRFSAMITSPTLAWGMHSVDEKIKVDAHLALIAWLHEYIQAVNDAKDK
ncbi:carboxypeptidase S [Diutina catenulata]